MISQSMQKKQLLMFNLNHINYLRASTGLMLTLMTIAKQKKSISY